MKILIRKLIAAILVVGLFLGLAEGWKYLFGDGINYQNKVVELPKKLTKLLIKEEYHVIEENTSINVDMDGYDGNNVIHDNIDWKVRSSIEEYYCDKNKKEFIHYDDQVKQNDDGLWEVPMDVITIDEYTGVKHIYHFRVIFCP